MVRAFITVLNMSLTASYVILAVILVRLILKKAPKAISYALWAAVGLRLSLPFTFESAFSLIPFRAQPISQSAAMSENVSFASSAGAALEAIGDAVNGGLGTITVHLGKTADGYPVTTEAYHSEVWLAFGSYIWVIGIAVLLVYSALSIILLNRRLRSAVPVEGNVYEAGNIGTPFVLGVFGPKIYIPSGLSEEERSCIILHERAHIRRFDHLVKIAAFLILCVHWFNPLVWVAFLLMSTDMEMSCDERVLREMDGSIKHAYSTTLLTMTMERRLIGGSPLAFGEGSIKGRIKNILGFKKPAAWVVAVSVALVSALVIGFMLSRPSSGDTSDNDLWERDHYSRLTVDDVRELAKKGDALDFGDFDGFRGADVSSNLDYHIMLYGVEGGYRLIVRTDGRKIDSAQLERIWDNSGSGIDIRYNDVDEFIKTHPSSELIESWRGITTGTPKDEVNDIMGVPDVITSGLWSEGYELIDGAVVLFLYDQDGNVQRMTKSLGKAISSIGVIRNSDEKKWTLSDNEAISKFGDALNNREKTNTVIDIRPQDYSVTVYFKDGTIDEYSLWLDKDVNVRGILMNNDSTWYLETESNPIFNEILS